MLCASPSTLYVLYKMEFQPANMYAVNMPTFTDVSREQVHIGTQQIAVLADRAASAAVPGN